MAYLLKDISNNIAFNTGSLTANLGTNIVASSNVSGLNVQGTYISDGVSALKIPADSSNNRPAGQTGYIRYNTDTNVIEYWNALNNAWIPIAQIPPSFTSISPSYVLEDVSLNYTITGGFFDTSSYVYFIGENDGIVYPSSSTTYISATSLTAVNSLTMSDASTNILGFKVRIINQNSGFSTTTGSAVLSFNRGPVWNYTGLLTGSGISLTNYTYATSPFQDLSASDFPPENIPITYFSTTNPLSGSAPLVTLDPSGRLIGTMPGVVSSTSYSFTAYPQDASGARGNVGTFQFNVIPATLSVSGFSLSTNYTITYVDSSNNIIGSPVNNGYTIYRFFPTSTTSGSVTPNFTSSNMEYLVVGGGGGGGSGGSGYYGAGGGAGGYRAGITSVSANTPYVVTVGQGGLYNSSTSVTGTNGASSVFSTITANGGGGGSSQSASAGSGGSGGGGSFTISLTGATRIGASGNSGGFTPPEGWRGGNYNVGGQGSPGGGALQAGYDTTTTPANGPISNITGANVTYATGGYGTPGGSPAVNNGTGNGGNGGRFASTEAGTNGSSGVVILRFPSLISYSPPGNWLNVSGYGRGQFIVSFVNSSNTVVSAPVSGGFTIYSFLLPTTGSVTPNFTGNIDYLMVAGGGGGGGHQQSDKGGGGGGAGGFISSFTFTGAAAGIVQQSALSVSNGVSYTCNVGVGGRGGDRNDYGNGTYGGQTGGNSVLSTITANGGGGGGPGKGGGPYNGYSGGSGGGAVSAGTAGGTGGSSTGTPTQGTAGGNGSGGTNNSAGGGGAGGAGGGITNSTGGNGGAGVTSSITGVSTIYAAGGGGAAFSGTPGTGGSGIGGNGGITGGSGNGSGGGNGLINTGSGGGGAGTSTADDYTGGFGGNGIIILRFASF